MKKQRILFISNLLILFSLAFFIYLLYPIAKAYFFPSVLPEEILKKEYSIFIPKIKASGIITANVNPWDEKEYKPVLQKSIAQAKGSSLPNQNGTQFLFAHSTGTFIDQTRYNTVFFRLYELERGDVIYVYFQGKRYEYTVREIKVVLPEDTKALTHLEKNQLILQTCTPLGTDWKRLLVYAEKND